MARTINFLLDDDDVRYILDQHSKLDFYKSKSLKRQSKGRHVALLGHIILIPKTTRLCSYFLTLCASIPI